MTVSHGRTSNCLNLKVYHETMKCHQKVWANFILFSKEFQFMR
jgi:hypothetical protein